jgi:arylsulfatase A-like enzyme
MVDDMGFSDLGCYGGEIQTPNLDRLAADGLRFAQFYNCAKCETTRAALLSGRYHPEVGIRTMRNCVTIAEAMRGGGYTTRMTGKWDNTLLMFLSDNGACPFQRTRPETLAKKIPPWDPTSYWTYDKGWAHACNTPFREYKRNQHEGGISTPFIVPWPDVVKEPGSITQQPGHLVDIMATCLLLRRMRASAVPLRNPGFVTARTGTNSSFWDQSPKRPKWRPSRWERWRRRGDDGCRVAQMSAAHRDPATGLRDAVFEVGSN